MKRLTIALNAVALIGVTFSFGSLLVADQYRYMDESGNIHFVDKYSSIPREYREQIYPPTPTPKLDKKQIGQLRKAQKDAENERIKKDREKVRDQKKRREVLERERRREERELKKRDDQRKIDKLGD